MQISKVFGVYYLEEQKEGLKVFTANNEFFLVLRNSTVINRVNFQSKTYLLSLCPLNNRIFGSSPITLLW